MQENLKRDLDHRKLCSEAENLHKLFLLLFPNQSTDEFGGRVKAFSKIASQKEINTSSKIDFAQLTQLSGIKSRAGWKKFMETFEANQLVTKEDDMIKITEKGQLVWNSLITFLSTLNKENQTPEPLLKGQYYEYMNIYITTDGKDTCRILTNWCLTNNSDKPLEKIRVDIAGEAPLKQELNFKHSKSIGHYDYLSNTPDHKVLRLFFVKPVLPGESIDYWHEYDWPGMFKQEWKPWDYFVTTDDRPIKAATLFFRILGKQKVKKNSFNLNTSSISAESINTGKFTCFEPIITSLENETHLVFRMLNIATKVRYKLVWDLT